MPGAIHPHRRSGFFLPLHDFNVIEGPIWGPFSSAPTALIGLTRILKAFICIVVLKAVTSLHTAIGARPKKRRHITR